MAWSSWQRLGEGFASNNRSLISVSNTNSGDSKSKRNLSHQPKESRQRCISQQAVTRKWNPTDFMSSFFIKGSSSSQKDDISWSDSSSEEDVKTGKDKKQTASCDRDRKRRIHEKLQTRIKRPAVDLASWKSKNQKSKPPITAKTKSDIPVSFSTDVKLIEQGKVIHSGPLNVEEGKQINEINWNTATFELDKSRSSDDCKNLDKQFSAQKRYGNENDIDIGKKQDEIITCKWSNSSFDGMDPFKASGPKNKQKYIHPVSNIFRTKNFEDVDIDESASEGDNDDENAIEESDVAEIASDESNDSIQPQKVLQSNSFTGTLALSQERASQQVEIGSVTSSLGDSPTSERVGASDWAIRFQQEVSPDSNRKGRADDVNQHDSAKKKQRYSSKSLVGQLSRLIKREKSTVRFWQHSSSKGKWNEDGCHKSITLEIVSMVKQFSLYVAQCQVLIDNDTLLHAKNCQLMLIRSHADKMGIQSGKTIQLFPPWKQMDEGEKIVILCANKIRVVPLEQKPLESASDNFGAANAHHEDSLTRNKKTVKISFKWACPCQQNPSIQSHKCPAHLSDHYIKYFSQMALNDKRAPSLHPTHLHLHSVQPSTPPRIPKVKRTLQQSLQEQRSGRDEMDCLPIFTATVLRVFRENIASQNSISLSVLLEDASGNLALVEHEDIDTSSHEALWSKLYNIMGKECVCQGLSLVTRRTKEKDSALFQVISGAWRTGKLLTKDSQDDSQIPQKIPSFCYILQCVGDANNCLRMMEIEERGRLDLTNLGQIVMDKIHHQRFSCVARVINVQDCINTSSGTRDCLFVCDPSHDKAGEVTAFHPLTVSETCVNLERNKDRRSQVCLLQDVIWNGDRVSADEYSTLLSQSSWSSLSVDKLIDNSLIDQMSSRGITVPSLGQTSTFDSFVKVSGYIVHINEDKCYSWEGCYQCGTELTTSDDTRLLHCPVCQRDVSDAETRMSMEVNILEDSCKDFTVRIDLSQRTITSLLPEEVPDEGLDMDLVLGRSVSAVAYVVDRTNDTVQLHQVDL